MELQVFVEELLGRGGVSSDPSRQAFRALYPASGFETLPLRLG
jgi:hypothetical protein